MKNLQKIVLTLVVINFQLNSMQMPIGQTEQTSFNSLPAEIKQMVIRHALQSSNVPQVAKTILSFNHTNRFLHNFVRNEFI